MILPLSQRLRRLLENPPDGAMAVTVKTILRPAGYAYGTLMRLRRMVYAKGWISSQNHPVPIINIGNITAGGTGKTPMIIKLALMLSREGTSVGIVARGYGSVDGHANDEERLIREAAPDCIYRANQDRNKAIHDAIAAGAEVVLMDDGFQRLGTARDLNIILIDALSPFGGGRVLPAGLLREPASALAAGDFIIITRSDQVSVTELSRIKNEITTHAPEAIIITAQHQTDCLRDEEGNRQDPKMLARRKVLALSGIARPEAFHRTLEDLGATVTETIIYPDHHCYFPSHLAHAWRTAATSGSGCVVTTSKDMVKLKPIITDQKPPVPLYHLDIKMVLKEEEIMLRTLRQIINKAKDPERDA